MYLFFDTETNGLPKDWKAPASDVDNWPRIVQLAWAQYDEQGNEISCRADIIKPEGFKLEKVASEVHGITDEIAEKGYSLTGALFEFFSRLENSKMLVAHNIRFDRKIVKSEMIRNNMPYVSLLDKDKIKMTCTMFASTAHCAIPGPHGNKWPKLDELYQKLFNEGFEGAHDALVDVRACARCFFELKRLGVIEG